MAKSDKPLDAPRVQSDDTVKGQRVPHPFTFPGNPQDPLNERIVEAVNRMGGVGREAEANYQAVLEALRKQSDAVVAIVAKEYHALPPEQHLARWSIVQLLAELANPQSLPFLNDVLSSPIPPERPPPTRGFPAAGEEVIIRTTAVEAVARIAATGEARALDLLRTHIQHPNFSVKRACVQAHLARRGPAGRDELLKLLPEKDRFLLDIRRVPVHEVPQPSIPDPGRGEPDDIPPLQLSKR